MALTEEQRRRMEENRKRALERKENKRLEQDMKEKSMATTASNGNGAPISIFDAGGFVATEGHAQSLGTTGSNNKKQRIDNAGSVGAAGEKKRGGNRVESTKTNSGRSSNSNENEGTNDDDGDESSPEDFELDASPYISKSEAQRSYCIPLGTLEVCSYIEKDNPHKRGWSKMKLYHRREVRKRARKRFGGKEGLAQERETRKCKRFEKDMAEMKDVFR